MHDDDHRHIYTFSPMCIEMEILDFESNACSAVDAVADCRRLKLQYYKYNVVLQGRNRSFYELDISV